MALLAKGIWVVLVDGEKALICENTGTPAEPRLRLHEKMAQELEPNRELATDRPGRMPDPGKGQRSAMEETDFNRQAKERFVAEVATRLNRLAAEVEIGRLVLAAPPQLLAVLRAELDDRVRGQVMAELPKTLTHHPLADLGRQVAELVDPL
ncbi:MAG: baeRF12 domain-containing protein [Alkalilacustris sp.]